VHPQTKPKPAPDLLAQEARSPGVVRIPPARPAKPFGWAVVVGVFVLGIVIGAAGLAVLQESVTSEQERFMDDVAAAWTAGDAEALRALYAEDAVLSSGGVTYEGVEEIVALSRSLPADFTVERSGDVLVGGTADAWIVTTFDLSSQTDTLHAVSVFEVVNGQIQQHIDLGD
jgi:hypothetical protein